MRTPFETRRFRGEFTEEMQGQKAVSPQALVSHVIKSIEAGKVEITPGIANVLKYASRIAPAFMLRQLSKVGVSKRVRS